jgi:ankyrin repeat protein
MVKLLLEKGAELESKDKSGRTPLSRAAADGREAVVKLLLEKGAELESKDLGDGRTPLSWAAANGHEAMVKLLLEKGAELESEGKYGQLPSRISQFSFLKYPLGTLKFLIRYFLIWPSQPRLRNERSHCK